MRRIAIIFVLFFLTTTLQAQNPLLIANFGVQQVNNNILVSWEIRAGNQCLGLQIEHSIDSLNFVSIYDFQGICGAGSSNEKYDFLHANPISNSKNYYRLKLGNDGYSNISSIKFVKIEVAGYSLFPNPVASSSKLYFSNTNKSMSLTIISSSGAEVYKAVNIEDSEFSFRNLFLSPGVYLFTLISDNGSSKINGKFIVQ